MTKEKSMRQKGRALRKFKWKEKEQQWGRKGKDEYKKTEKGWSYI